jgi:hypothetical protein
MSSLASLHSFSNTPMVVSGAGNSVYRGYTNSSTTSLSFLALPGVSIFFDITLAAIHFCNSPSPIDRRMCLSTLNRSLFISGKKNTSITLLVRSRCCTYLFRETQSTASALSQSETISPELNIACGLSLRKNPSPSMNVHRCLEQNRLPIVVLPEPDRPDSNTQVYADISA